jgi:dimethylglycine catabolism B
MNQDNALGLWPGGQAMDATIAKATTLCAYCPKMCRSACPVSETEKRESVTPGAKMSLVHLGRSGGTKLTTAAAHKVVEACTGCGACSEQCAHGNPVAETLFSARAAIPTPRSQQLRDAFAATGDAKGRDARRALGDIPIDAHAAVAYFPGCTRCHHDGAAAMDRDRRALAIAFGKDIPACEVRAQGADSAQCCGYPLYADGQVDALTDNLRRLQQLWSHHEVVVTPDPGCAYVLSTVRQQLLGHDKPFPQVISLVEALGAHASQFARRAQHLTVRYHDPCYLGRRQRSFDAPRTLLAEATGRPPLEFVRHHDDADCSGGGGLYPISNAAGAKDMANRRAEQIRGHEPTAVLVTACPSARRNFQRAGHVAVDLVDVLLGEVLPQDQP